MSKQWYVRQGGKVFGPMPSDSLRQCVTDGRVHSEAEVALTVGGPWHAITSVKGLRFAPAATMPPMPEFSARNADDAREAPRQRKGGGEETLWEGRPRLRSRIGSFVLCGLFFWLVLPIIRAIGLWLSIRSTRYELTTERLRITTGFIAKHVEEMELYRVKDTTFRQTVAQRILGIATVDVSSSDTTTPHVQIANVLAADAKQTRETIRALVEGLRERKRIREVDYA